MEYPNDRKRLVLLSYMDDRSRKNEELFRKLRNIYTDNDSYSGKLRDELVKSSYLKVMYEKSKTGAVIESTVMYKITPTGIGAINSGRFPSELDARRNEKRNLYIGWGSIALGGVGGILSILSVLGILQYVVDYLRSLFLA